MNGLSAEPNGNGKSVILGRNVLVPASVIGGAIALLLMVGSYVKSNVTDPIAETKADVAEIKRTLTDRWTGTNMKMWELEMRRSNPTLTMPNTWDIVNGQRGVDK